MSPIRLLLAALAAGFLLAGCADPRRDLAREWLQTHPPEGFEVVALPESIPLTTTPDGTSEAVVSVRYRLARATVEPRDALTSPRGRDLTRRLQEIRGWALGALPAEHPLRDSILTAVQENRGPLPVKRLVTPAGTEVEALARVTLRRGDAGWRVIGGEADARVPGAPDLDPARPLEDAPEVAARLARLEALATSLETARREYLEERQRVAARSLQRLRAALRTGRTYSGQLPDGSSLRLVVTRGLESAAAATVVLTARRTEESSARFTGGLAPTPSGETIWRAAQVVTLSAPTLEPTPAATNAKFRPVLSLATDSANENLAAELQIAAAAPISIPLQPAETVDLIPEAGPSTEATP